MNAKGFEKNIEIQRDQLNRDKEMHKSMIRQAITRAALAIAEASEEFDKGHNPINISLTKAREQLARIDERQESLRNIEAKLSLLNQLYNPV